MKQPGLFTITTLELRRLVVTPLPWVLLALTQLILGLVFVVTLGDLQETPGLGREEGVTAYVTGGVFGFAAAWLLLVVPLLGMRSLSEEYRTGTIRLPGTAPVSPWRIVLGKYLALLIPVAAIVGLAAAMVASLNTGTRLDTGLLGAASLFLFLMGATYAAVALACSSLTRQPAAAAAGALGILLLLWMFHWLGTRDLWLAPLFMFLSPADHLEDGLVGLVSLRGLLQPLVITGVFLCIPLLRLALRGHNLHTLRRQCTRPVSALFAGGWVSALVVLTVLAASHPGHADWSASGRHSLSEASEQILAQLEGPLDVIAYAEPDEELRRDIRHLLIRYQRHHDDINLDFIDPAAAPGALRNLGAGNKPWALAITRGERTEICTEATEKCFSQALQRLARGEGQWVAFLEGHGGRRLDSESGQSLGDFVQALQDTGLRVGRLNLSRNPAIPDNAALVVIPGARGAPLSGELQILRDYVRDGGAILWLADPDTDKQWQPLAEALGVELMPGTLLYPDYTLLGTPHPAVFPVTDFGNHRLGQQLDASVMFAFARPLRRLDETDWESRVFARTLERSWAEAGSLEGELRFNPEAGDRAGPLALGLALERRQEDVLQRAAVVGDTDFVSNHYLAHGDNLRLGLNLVNWLAGSEAQLDIRPGELRDATLTLGPTGTVIMLVIFVPGIPGLLLLAGGLVYWRRTRT